MANDIRVLRTALGEVLVTKVEEETDESLTLIDPAALVPNQKGVALVPLVMWQRPYSGARFTVKAHFIVGEFDKEQADGLIKDYIGASAGIAIAQPGATR